MPLECGYSEKFDLLLFISVICICILGVIMIYSSSCIWAEYKFDDPLKYFKAQSLFFTIGLILMIVTSKFHINTIKTKQTSY